MLPPPPYILVYLDATGRSSDTSSSSSGSNYRSRADKTTKRPAAVVNAHAHAVSRLRALHSVSSVARSRSVFRARSPRLVPPSSPPPLPPHTALCLPTRARAATVVQYTPLRRRPRIRFRPIASHPSLYRPCPFFASFDVINTRRCISPCTRTTYMSTTVHCYCR